MASSSHGSGHINTRRRTERGHIADTTHGQSPQNSRGPASQAHQGTVRSTSVEHWKREFPDTSKKKKAPRMKTLTTDARAPYFELPSSRSDSSQASSLAWTIAGWRTMSTRPVASYTTVAAAFSAPSFSAWATNSVAAVVAWGATRYSSTTGRDRADSSDVISIVPASTARQAKPSGSSTAVSASPHGRFTLLALTRLCGANRWASSAGQSTSTATPSSVCHQRNSSTTGVGREKVNVAGADRRGPSAAGFAHDWSKAAGYLLCGARPRAAR